MRFIYIDRRFSDLTEAIKHVKLHSIENNTTKISCLVPNCNRTYQTFDSLRVHVKKCIVQNKIKKRTEEVTLIKIYYEIELIGIQISSGFNC